MSDLTDELREEAERGTCNVSFVARSLLCQAADALDAQDAEIAALRAEVDHYEQSIIEMGEKLRAIINLIRGEPPEDEAHSTHDAVDLVRGLIMHNDQYAAAVGEQK